MIELLVILLREKIKGGPKICGKTVTKNLEKLGLEEHKARNRRERLIVIWESTSTPWD